MIIIQYYVQMRMRSSNRSILSQYLECRFCQGLLSWRRLSKKAAVHRGAY